MAGTGPFSGTNTRNLLDNVFVSNIVGGPYKTTITAILRPTFFNPTTFASVTSTTGFLIGNTITITGATVVGNNGTFSITNIGINLITYNNSQAVTSVGLNLTATSNGPPAPYTTNVDMINVNNVYVSGDIIGPSGSFWNNGGGGGPTGPTGAGATGPTGPGITGPTGSTGAGVTGATGPTGAGVTGPTGAGGFNPNVTLIKIGTDAGASQTGASGMIAIGSNAAQFNTSASSIAIGIDAGKGGSIGLINGIIAIGLSAAVSGNQADNAIAIGTLAGNSGQGINSIAIGNGSGGNTQGFNSIAIGYGAGGSAQGNNSIAIGTSSENTTGNNNVIVLNASGSALNSNAPSAFFVSPVRDRGPGLPSGCKNLGYDPSSGEIFYY